MYLCWIFEVHKFQRTKISEIQRDLLFFLLTLVAVEIILADRRGGAVACRKILFNT